MEVILVTWILYCFFYKYLFWFILMKFSYFVNLTGTNWTVKIIKKSILKNSLKIRLTNWATVLTTNHPDLATWQEGLKDRSLPTTMRPTLNKTTHPILPIKIYNNANRNYVVNFIVKIVCLWYFRMFFFFFISLSSTYISFSL